MPHKKGIMHYKNRITYEGEFYFGQKQGEGVMTYPNGDVYEGFFKNDMKNGYGQLITKTQLKQKIKMGEVKEGLWKDDNF